MVWTRPRDVGCQPRKTGPMKLLSSIAARERSHQGVQGGRRIGLWVLCWTKELISSSYDGGRSGSSRRPVVPSFVCAGGADHVTTSRLRAHNRRLFSGASDCIPMQPSTGTSCACRSASQLIFPVLLLLPRVMGAAISRGVGVNIAPNVCSLSRRITPQSACGQRARARYATFPRTSGRWKVMITPGSRALALPDRRG